MLASELKGELDFEYPDNFISSVFSATDQHLHLYARQSVTAD